MGDLILYPVNALWLKTSTIYNTWISYNEVINNCKNVLVVKQQDACLNDKLSVRWLEMCITNKLNDYLGVCTHRNKETQIKVNNVRAQVTPSRVKKKPGSQLHWNVPPMLVQFWEQMSASHSFTSM